VSPQNVIRQLLILALSLVASPGESLARSGANNREGLARSGAADPGVAIAGGRGCKVREAHGSPRRQTKQNSAAHID